MIGQGFKSDATPSSNPVASIIRNTYLAAIFLWLGYTCLFPMWQGKTYHYDKTEKRWRDGGRFGITGGGSLMTNKAPLWSPPRSGGGLPSSVRWPLAPVSQQHHIEIIPAFCFWRFTAGLLLAGIVARFAYRMFSHAYAADRRDRVITTATTISISLLVANALLFVLAVLSMGYALSDPVVCGVLFVALIAGILWGPCITRGRDAANGT
jgi:hypothetical protein